MRISDWSSDVCSSDLIVAFTFPHLFTKRELKFANAELLNSYPDPWERLTGQKILPGQSRSRDEQAFLTENANRLIVGSEINTKKYDGYVECNAQKDRDRRREPQNYIVTSAKYKSRKN